ncbi:hypothetical protein J2W14_000215 [Pseudarthrobacter oxydans]|nr:hypothetical protein [Pseudarthrobacter oxydans]
MLTHTRREPNSIQRSCPWGPQLTRRIGRPRDIGTPTPGARLLWTLPLPRHEMLRQVIPTRDPRGSETCLLRLGSTLPHRGSFMRRPDSFVRVPCDPSGLHEQSTEVPAVRELSQPARLSRRRQFPKVRASKMKGGRAAAPALLVLRRNSGRSARCLRIETECRVFGAASPKGSPSATTHRFLHRCYAHSYPQTVRDLSQGRSAFLQRGKRVSPSPASRHWFSALPAAEEPPLPMPFRPGVVGQILHKYARN